MQYNTEEAQVKATVAEAVEAYRDSGLGVPFPLPYGEKKEPPRGVTGKSVTPEASAQKAEEAWKTAPTESNIGLRLAPNVLVLDVDAHGGKPGAKTKKALENKLVPLPDTSSCTRHGAEAKSRHYYFTVPEGMEWKPEAKVEIDGKTFGAIDVRHMRLSYTVVWPSQYDGDTYQWYTPTGELSDRPPRVDELAELPQEWIEYLSTGAVSDTSAADPTECYNFTEAMEWLEVSAWSYDGEPGAIFQSEFGAGKTEALIARFEDSAHPTMVERQTWAMKLAVFEGEAGLRSVLSTLEEMFCDAAGPRRADHSAAVREWRSALTGAVKLVRGEVEAGRKTWKAKADLLGLGGEPRTYDDADTLTEGEATEVLVSYICEEVPGVREESVQTIVSQWGPEKVRDQLPELIAAGVEGLHALAFQLGREAADALVHAGSTVVYDEDYDVLGAGADLATLYGDDSTESPAYGGLFYSTGLHILAAPGGTGKTWQGLAAAIPTVSDSAGSGPYGVYVDMDNNTVAHLAGRAAALGCGPERMAGRDLRLVDLADADLGKLRGVIRALETAANPPSVVVVDHLTRLMAAMGADTNSDTAAANALGMFKPLAAKCCVVVLDHIGKSDPYNLRGSSAKRDNVDAVVILVPGDGRKRLSEGVKLSSSVYVNKDRRRGIIDTLCIEGDQHDGGVWTLEQTDDDVVVLPDGRTVDPLRVCLQPARRVAEAKVKAEARKAVSDAEQVAAVVTAKGGEVSGYRTLLGFLTDGGMAKNRAEEAIAKAEDNGLVVVTKRSGAASIYRVETSPTRPENPS